MTLAALGTFITTVLLILIQYRLDTLNPRAKKILVIAAITDLAAASDALTAIVITWLKLGKHELSLTLNGALGGLLSSYSYRRAPCMGRTPEQPYSIGMVAGFIVTYGYNNNNN